MRSPLIFASPVRHDERGFTLIEMAIVIIITGLLIAGAASAYSMYLKDKKRQDTVTRTNAVVTSIGNFRNLFGRYPCPASLTETRDDPAYGHETCDLAAMPADGTCANGFCTEISTRAAIDYMVGGAVVNGQPPVTAGFVPFRTLNLPESYAYDGYGGRLKYAVTRHLTASDNFEADTGGIDILNDQGVSIIAPPGSAHFLIISHGEDQSGAYTNAGVQIPCTAGNKESDNCTENRMNATYRLSRTVTANSADTFDDTLLYFIKNDIPLWQISEANQNNIHQKPPGDVAFYFSSSSAIAETAQSAGVVRAQQKLQTNEVCEGDGTDCFPSSLIAGDLNTDPLDMTDDLKCPPGEIMYKVENKEAKCAPEVWALKCPGTEALIGFDNDGEPICQNPPPRCQPKDVGVCSETKSLPLGNLRDEVTVTGGDTGYKTYRCTKSGSDAKWKLIDNHTDGYACECNPLTDYDNVACDVYQKGFAGGTVRTEWQFICPAATWIEIGEVPGYTFAEQCTCVETTQTRDGDCPDYWTGSIKETRQHVCPADGTPYWTPWVEDPSTDTCTCVNYDEQQTLDCPGGLTGRYKEQRTFDCTAGTQGEWGDWEELSGYTMAQKCHCVEDTDEQTVDCPDGQDGFYYEIRAFTCPDAEWSDWEEDPARNKADNCKTPPEVTCEWNASGTGLSDQTFAVGPHVGTTCECGTAPTGCHEKTGTGSYTDYATCSCN